MLFNIGDRMKLLSIICYYIRCNCTQNNYSILSKHHFATRPRLNFYVAKLMPHPNGTDYTTIQLIRYHDDS